MIDKNVVTRIVDEWLEGKDYFLVDVTVSPDDKIVVEIDHAEGVWIDDCVELSRYIESKLDREEEDYELEVGSDNHLHYKSINIMKVSIITSCYNREATIRGAIESVLEQDYPYIEYIVVDGASKDNSLAVINEYKNGIDTIISEPDKGMYEAINKGIRAATGDIIGLIHSDDFLFSSHTISDIVKTFEEQDADMIYGNGVFVDYDDTNLMILNRPYSGPAPQQNSGACTPCRCKRTFRAAPRNRHREYRRARRPIRE